MKILFKIIYYVFATILFIIEFPLLIIMGIFAFLFWILGEIHDGVISLNHLCKNKFLLKIYNVEVMYPGGWKRINKKLLHKHEAEEVSAKWSKKGYKTIIR